MPFFRNKNALRLILSELKRILNGGSISVLPKVIIGCFLTFLRHACLKLWIQMFLYLMLSVFVSVLRIDSPVYLSLLEIDVNYTGPS